MFQVILSTPNKVVFAENTSLIEQYKDILNVNVTGVKIKNKSSFVTDVFGGSSEDYFTSIVATEDGGYIVVGYSNSVDGDMSGLNRGKQTSIIVKYDIEGNVEWKNSFGGSEDDYFTSVAVTEDGGYVVVGDSYSEDGDMSGLVKIKGWFDNIAIIVKYDKEGNIEWKNSFGGSENDYFTSVAVTEDGGYIVVGNSHSRDGDMSGLNKGWYDAIIVKYDKEGNVEWKNSFGGSEDDYFSSVAVTEDGGYIVVGNSPSIDGDMSGLNKGWYDAIIVKYDIEGNVEWKNSFGGSDRDYFTSVAVTEDEGYIAVGHSRSVDQDLAFLNKGNTFAIVVKFDKEGNVIWKNSFGGKDRDYFNSVAILKNENYIAVGTTDSYDGDMIGHVISGNIAIVTKIYENKHVVEIGKNYKLEFEIQPSNATNKKVIWESTDNNIVQVDQYGVVNTVGIGTAKVIVETSDGGYKDEVEIVVEPIKLKSLMLKNIKYAKSFGGSSFDYFIDVDATEDGGYITVGYSNSGDGDMTGFNKGSWSSTAIIVKYDREGNIEWKNSFGGSKGDYFSSVAVTEDGGYIAVGYSRSLDGDMAGLNKGWYDAIIVKYDIDGNIEWKNSFGGSEDDHFTSVAVTEDGGYIAVGYSRSLDGDIVNLQNK